MSESIPRRRSWLWLQGLGCGAALSIVPAPMLLMGVLLAPGLLCYAVERTPGKPHGESMVLLGLASGFMPLRHLWDAGHTIEACLDILGELSPIGLSWMVAAAGWLMGEMAQIIARQVGEVAAKRRIAQLRREREELIEEWGSLDPPRVASAPPRGAAPKRR